MTLSTLAKTKTSRWSLDWLFISIFCAVFSTIYEIFSHGVYSNAMIFLFVYPLLLGAVPCFLLEKAQQPYPNRFYQDGVFTITLASLLTGILEIYGTSSVYTTWFLYAGIALWACGIVLMFLRTKHSH